MSFGYDTVGRRVSRSDALGNTNTTVFDAAGRAVAMVNPLGFTRTNVFDAANRLVAHSRPIREYEFDDLRRGEPADREREPARIRLVERVRRG